MFWKKRKAQPKEISPSTSQKEDRIAEAILSLKYTVANNSDANRKQERREDIGNKLLQVATLLQLFRQRPVGDLRGGQQQPTKLRSSVRQMR